MYAGSKFDPLVLLIERLMIKKGWTRRGFDVPKGEMYFNRPQGSNEAISAEDLKAMCLEHTTAKVSASFERVTAKLYTSGDLCTPTQVTLVVVTNNGSLPFATSDIDGIKQIKGVSDARAGRWNESVTVTWYTNGRDPWAEAKPIQAAITKLLS